MDDDIANGILEELSAIRRMMAAYLMYAAISASTGIELAEMARIGGKVDQHTEDLKDAARRLEERVEDYV